MKRSNIVFDTSTLAGAASPNSIPRASYDTAQKLYNVVYSDKTGDELIEVLSRPKLLERYGRDGLTQFFYEYIDTARHVDVKHNLTPLAADPKDTMFLELAIASNAKAIVSSDAHLLSLKHFALAHTPTVQIWTPAQFLQLEIGPITPEIVKNPAKTRLQVKPS